RAMAESAVRDLVGDGRGRELQHRIFPTELIIRQSCGCP
ncbi:MAG TPA: LacI family transcriptional regulator, partial [Arthrobacter bacterium]|nr:LacI family transcriptional regulator [Arthrobacter sp.]HCC39033.1 LacI family transcriptional regulator [Arthrobacter sp.]